MCLEGMLAATLERMNDPAPSCTLGLTEAVAGESVMAPCCIPANP